MSEYTEIIPDNLPRVGVRHGYVDANGRRTLDPGVPKARCSGWKGRGLLPKKKRLSNGYWGIYFSKEIQIFPEKKNCVKKLLFYSFCLATWEGMQTQFPC